MRILEYRQANRKNLPPEKHTIRWMAGQLVHNLTDEEFRQVFQWQNFKNTSGETVYQITFLNCKLIKPAIIKYKKPTIKERLIYKIKNLLYEKKKV